MIEAHRLYRGVRRCHRLSCSGSCGCGALLGDGVTLAELFAAPLRLLISGVRVIYEPLGAAPCREDDPRRCQVQPHPAQIGARLGINCTNAVSRSVAIQMVLLLATSGASSNMSVWALCKGANSLTCHQHHLIEGPDVCAVGGGSVFVPRSRGGCTALCAARSLKLNWFRSRPGGGCCAACPSAAGASASATGGAVTASLPSMAASASCLLAASACSHHARMTQLPKQHWLCGHDLSHDLRRI